MRTVIIFCLCLFTFTVQAQDDVNYTYMDSLFQQLPEVLVKGERPVVKAERGKTDLRFAPNGRTASGE